MGEQKSAYIYAGLAVLFWSTISTAFKIALRNLDFIQLLFYATLTSIFVLLIIIIAQGKLRILFSYSYRDYLKSALIGLLNPFLF